MKNFLYLIIFSKACLFGAGPISHLYFAEIWYEQNAVFEEETRRDFILGNLFPNIRYIAPIERSTTHLQVASFEEIDASFRGGLKLHAWIDIVREKLVSSSGIYKQIHPIAGPYSSIFLKLLEDEILCEFYDGRDCCVYFNDVIDDERAFVADEALLEKWHTLVKWSQQFRPSWLLYFASIKGETFKVPFEILYEWSFLLPKLAQDPFFRDYAFKLFETLRNDIQGERRDHFP